MQPAIELLNRAVDLYLPERASDAGPESQPMDWLDHLYDATENLQLAASAGDVRQTGTYLRAARESMARAEELWKADADREHAEFLRRW